MRYVLILFLAVWSLSPGFAQAEFEWASCTLDNDLLLGYDSGYTNGIYFSFYDIGVGEVEPAPSRLLKPVLWTLSDQTWSRAVSTYSIGQAMITPKDITIENPDEDELPYAGLLFFNNTYLIISKQYADKISTTIGFVGPLSFAEQSQKTVHKAIGSDEPMGWDTQIKNEFVFRFDRARAWQTWSSQNGYWDIVTNGELSVGTISSSISAGALFRFGTNLTNSYAISLLNSTKTTNPAAVGGDWYVYAGGRASYLFNQIFTDGNTYRNSRSVDYDRGQVGVTCGFTFSWRGFSLSCALNDLNILRNKSEKHLKALTQYGTLTLAFKI